MLDEYGRKEERRKTYERNKGYKEEVRDEDSKKSFPVEFQRACHTLLNIQWRLSIPKFMLIRTGCKKKIVIRKIFIFSDEN
jgi:hypothetical protein